MKTTERTHCIRCGTCCRSGSPTLHLEDVEKVVGGRIGAASLSTLRKGEVVRDNIRGGLTVLHSERIKIREREKPPSPGACSLLDFTGKACQIYENRPAQCAALACWDTSAFMEVYERPFATRGDLVQDGPVLALMGEHDEYCAYLKIERVVRRIGADGNAAVQELMDIIRYDHRVRHVAVHQLGRSPEETELLFGRPLTGNLAVFGLKAEARPDGSLLLKRLDSAR